MHNLRDYTTDKHRRVDDYPFGGFAGMVMQCQPIDACISALKAQRDYDEIIFTTPDGEQFDQPMANQLSMKENIIILCGHYKGIDYRIREHLITKEVSIGDYVLTGGELAAGVMADAVVRLVPGVLSDEQSALSDSFRTTCWQHLSIRAQLTTKDGRCQKSCFQDMTQKSRSGNSLRALSERNGCDQTF